MVLQKRRTLPIWQVGEFRKSATAPAPANRRPGVPQSAAPTCVEPTRTELIGVKFLRWQQIKRTISFPSWFPRWSSINKSGSRELSPNLQLPTRFVTTLAITTDGENEKEKKKLISAEQY
jgi:hypothetical protein